MSDLEEQEKWNTFFANFCKFNAARAANYAYKFTQQRMQFSTLPTLIDLFEKGVEPAVNSIEMPVGDKVAIIHGMRQFMGAKKEKVLRVEDLYPANFVAQAIARVEKYILRTNEWECVLVIGKRLAATFPHNTPQWAREAKIAGIQSLPNATVARSGSAEVIHVNPHGQMDFILLKTDFDLCDEEPRFTTSYVAGTQYVQVGLSGQSLLGSPQSINVGVLCSDKFTPGGHLLGSAGSKPGDSGGGVFDLSGAIIGMVVGSEQETPPTVADTIQRGIDWASSRYVVKALIVPGNALIVPGIALKLASPVEPSMAME